MIVLMAGLPGTGKSALASALSEHLSGSVLSKDAIRHALFAARDVEYTTEQDDFVMGIMLYAAERILQKHPERYLFLDGRTFSRRDQVERVIAAAQDWGQPWKIVECLCSDETARARLESQASTREHPAGNRSFSLYLEIKQRFEPITQPKIVINTDEPLDQCVERALAALL
jgi:adenylylsulfate kinase